MKKNIGALLAIQMALMASSKNGFNDEEQFSVESVRNPEPINPREVIPFNQREGVINIIKDYNLIKEGKSKKGITKQSRIKNKVSEWLESGMLLKIDIENNAKQ